MSVSNDECLFAELQDKENLCFLSGKKAKNNGSVRFSDIWHPKCQAFEIYRLLDAHLAFYNDSFFSLFL